VRGKLKTVKQNKPGLGDNISQSPQKANDVKN
jgi:hypothetical protein